MWIFLLEEYGPDITFIRGKKNIVADTLSILSLNSNEETTQNPTYKK